MSFENLKYLNVDQALADLAAFIVWFKASTPGLENSKVILVGGSYAGTMAVWMRQKYPHLVAGSWASSAPLLAKVDFVGKRLKQVYVICVVQIICLQNTRKLWVSLSRLSVVNIAMTALRRLLAKWNA